MRPRRRSSRARSRRSGSTGSRSAAARRRRPSVIIRSISVVGAQRLEPNTILSYIQLRPGQALYRERLDQALKDLLATELFADVGSATAETGDSVIEVRENPVINRIVLEGNKRLKDDKITPEIKLAPRQIFTRSKVRADVARIIELYKRQGRFAADGRAEDGPARPEPRRRRVRDQRRAQVQGPRRSTSSATSSFRDGELRGEMATKAGAPASASSARHDSYDPDRLAYDQQKLRQFYLTAGLCRFPRRLRGGRADAGQEGLHHHLRGGGRQALQVRRRQGREPDPRLRQQDDDRARCRCTKGDWYNAKLVEDTVDRSDRDRRPVRLCLRRRQPEVSSATPKT